MIKKKEEAGKSYPTYHLVIKNSDYSSLGFWMNHFTVSRLLDSKFITLNEKQQLRIMTTLIGVYTVFVDIQSWKLASKKKSPKEQFKIRSSFLTEALPLLTTSSMNEFKERFWGTHNVPDMYKKNEHRKEMYEYEKTLKKDFPKEYKYCKEMFDGALGLEKFKD